MALIWTGCSDPYGATLSSAAYSFCVQDFQNNKANVSLNIFKILLKQVSWNLEIIRLVFVVKVQCNTK